MSIAEVAKPSSPRPALEIPKIVEAHPLVSQWIAFDAKGRARVLSGRVELGQGSSTALRQIAADELDLRFDQIDLVAGDTRSTPNEGFTSGSQSIEQGGRAVRLAASAARALLLERAAQLTGAKVEELSVSEGEVLRNGKPTGHRYATFASGVDLARDIAKLARPKPASERRLSGTSQRRPDLERKLSGEAFIQDLVLDGMAHGRVLHPPSPHRRLARVDDAGLEQKYRLLAVVRDGSFLGVVARSEHDADEAIMALAERCEWTKGADAPANVLAAMAKSTAPVEVVVEQGAPAQAAGRRFETTVTRPYLAHASIGTSCAVSTWKDQRLTVWSHTQGVFPLRAALAMTLGIDKSAIDVIHRDGAGCYGHNGADDVALDAALLARALPGTPVRVLWSRADELASSPLGSGAVIKVAATVDDQRIVAMTVDVISQPYGHRPTRDGRAHLLAAEHLEGATQNPPSGDIPMGTERNAKPGYDIPALRVTKRIPLELPYRTSSLRALGAYINVYALETFMDEIAHAVGADAFEFRLAHLRDERARAVLTRLRDLCGWPGAKREGQGMGIAYARYKNAAAYFAVAALVSAEGADVRVLKLWSVVDAGEVINPDGLANQMEGGMIQAASWTLKEAVRFEGDAVANRSWETYPILRFSETPETSVDIVAHPEEPPLGVAEAAQGPTAAAIGNAVFNALGARVRDLPITPDSIARAI